MALLCSLPPYTPITYHKVLEKVAPGTRPATAPDSVYRSWQGMYPKGTIAMY